MRPPHVGWILLGGLLAFATWGAFGWAAFTHRGVEEGRWRVAADSLESLIQSGRCVWIAPRDTVRRRGG